MSIRSRLLAAASPLPHWVPPTPMACGRSRVGASISAMSPASPTTPSSPVEFRVVTTLAQGEAGTQIRFVSVLAPGQRVVLSTPHQASAIEISRNGNSLLVRKANAISN